MPCPTGSAGAGFGFGTTGKLGRAWYRCMGGALHFGWASRAVHGAWHWCMVVHAASCMGGVPDGGWVNACVYYFQIQMIDTAFPGGIRSTVRRRCRIY